MPSCNGRDTGCNIPGSVRRLTFGWCLVTRVQRESVQWRKAKDGLRADAPSGFGYADVTVHTPAAGAIKPVQEAQVPFVLGARR